MKPLGIIVLIFLVVPCFGQDTHSVQLAKGISRYRSFLLEGNRQKRQKLGLVLRKLERLDVSKEKLEKITFRIGLLSLPDSLVDIYWKEYLLEKISQVKAFDSITNAEFNVLIENSDLYDLTSMGVLELDYPFIPKTDCDLFDELEFYQVRNGERVGEVGAGGGEFSVLLAMIYDSLSMQVNDIDSFAYDYMIYKVRRLKPLLGDDQIRIICSDSKDTHFEANSLDKIFIRNSYHHFKHEEEMLQSISAALKADGQLFLKEAPPDQVKDPNCSRAMREKTILSELKEGGFALTARQVLGDHVLYKFEKAEVLSTNGTN